jgi:hypothetical protein
MRTETYNHKLAANETEFRYDAATLVGSTPLTRFASLAIAAIFLNLILLLVIPAKPVILALIVSLTIAGAFSIPLHYAPHVILVYYSVEGLVKMLSNYHPVLHVSGDILVILFALRSVLDRATGGIAKLNYTPFLPLFMLFSFWVLVQFFNPFSLGIIPSLAGLKIYLVPPLLLFIAYHHIDRQQLVPIALLITGLAATISAISIVEYFWGQQFVFSISPAYSRAARDIFIGSQYRPFGTTSIPGMPATWVALATPFAAYALFQNRVLITKAQRAIPLAFFALAIPTLLICQTRLSMLQSALGLVLVLGYNKEAMAKRLSHLLLFAVIASGPILYKTYFGDWQTGIFATKQAEVISKRVKTLGAKDTYLSSRENPLPRIWSDMQKMYFLGLGLSRVGAAAGPWTDRIRNHPYFQDVNVGWADNLMIAIFHELGILGLLTYLFLYLKILSRLYSSSRNQKFEFSNGTDHLFVWSCFVISLITLLSGMAAEGALYAPVSIILWISFGIGLKEASHARR